MKKLFLSLFAVIGSFAAFGQDNAYVNFDPVSGSELSTLNTNIKVTLNAEAATATAAVVQTIGGYGSIQYAPDPEISIIEEVDGEKVINIPLTSDLWGNPYFEMYYLQVMVVPMTDDMTPIETEDGDYMMGMATYTCADSGDARLELTFPNQQNINNEEYTLAQAYQGGTGTLYFSKVVDTLGASGSLSVFDAYGDDLVFPIDIEIGGGEWSDMDGLFVVNFTFDPEDIDVNEISKLEYSFEGFTSEGKNIDVDSVILTQKSSRKVARKNNKSKMASEIEVSNEGFSVFNLQGVLVKENATNADVSKLPKGLYIANGKKIVVK